VFGDRQSGAYLHKFSWTRILRHRIVRHRASPDDPGLADYWAWRRRKVPLPINKTTQELTDAQDGRCSICGGLLYAAVEDRPQNPREWEQRLATSRQTINTIAASKEAEPRLVHAECRHGHGLALHSAYEPSGLA
jgi:RNA-directed DNA polymerase